MQPGISTDFKELVRSRTDLVALVGETISLTPHRGGSDHVGLCPFHDDHTPSFHVYPDRQSYRCWVCDEGGDCFSFLMKVENVGFRESLEMLARRANVELPKTYRRRSPEDGKGKSDLYEIVDWAEHEFHRCLLSSPQASRARDYLTERRFTAETIAKFRVGYHPADWQWLLSRARDTLTPEQLFAARLVRQRKEGNGYYDDFVDRVMFPIRDERGRPVAFGGRVLPGQSRSDVPKYLNSPESVLFAKSRLLYGLDVAREAIRRSGIAVVVEGYTDCMMAHQHGLANVVGTLGTALTETHVIALKRFARQVVLVYDGDEAGRHAADRSLSKFLAQEVDLRILTLPDGLDPAEFLDQHGADALNEHIHQAPEAWEHKYALTIERFGTDSLDARQQVLSAMLELVAAAPGLSGTKRENLVLGKLSQRLSLKEQMVREWLVQLRRNRSNRRINSAEQKLRPDTAETAPLNGLPGNVSRGKQEQLEQELLGIIFAVPGTIEEIRREIRPEELTDPRRRQLLETCYRLAEQGDEPTVARVMVDLENAALKQEAVRIDDLSRRQKLPERLKDDDHRRHMADSQQAEKTYLEHVIDGLKWRAEEERHERSKGQMAQCSGISTGLDSDAKERLRRASEFHQKRVKKKTLT